MSQPDDLLIGNRYRLRDRGARELVTPEQTRQLLTEAGFGGITIEDTGLKYVASYSKMIAVAEQGATPPLGIHVLLGEDTLLRARNSMRNIQERCTHPVQVICHKPA